MRVTIPSSHGEELAERSADRTFDWVPAAALSLFLLVATWYQGAFAVRYWAPVALLALAVLSAAAAAGAISVPERATRVALAGIWLLAVWSLLSAVWADSPGRALEGGARTTLYAALFTVPAALIASGRRAARVGAALVIGLGCVAAVTAVSLLTNAGDHFLAGRLDDPVGYRNATACFFALAFWPFVSVAGRRQMNALVRALALAGAALVLGLAFLTQARGVLLGLVVGGVVAIGLGPDRLRRAWSAVVVVGGLAVFADRLLTPFRAFSDDGDAGPADIAFAIDALTALVLLAFAAGLLGALLDGGLRIEGAVRTALRRVFATALVLATIAAIVGGIAAIGNPVTFARDRIDEFRSLETAAPGETRLTFGGGQRGDLWRISLIEFGEHPLTGVGEGSYSFRYYEERRTDRNLSTPHSLVFSVIAETGFVGTLAMLAFLGGIVAAIIARWRAAAPEARWWASSLFAAAVVGLGQAGVDWIWLIPGVVGVCFLMLGLGVAALRPVDTESPPPGRLPLRIAAAAAFAVLTLVTLTLYLGDVSVRKARAARPADTQVRLDAAHAAERLLPWSIVPHYLQASVLEDLGRVPAARAELREALDREPRNFVTYALMGDLELRAGRRAVALRMYRRARALNPRDVGLRKLSRGEITP